MQVQISGQQIEVTREGRVRLTTDARRGTGRVLNSHAGLPQVTQVCNAEHENREEGCSHRELDERDALRVALASFEPRTTALHDSFVGSIRMTVSVLKIMVEPNRGVSLWCTPSTYTPM